MVSRFSCAAGRRKESATHEFRRLRAPIFLQRCQLCLRVTHRLAAVTRFQGNSLSRQEASSMSVGTLLLIILIIVLIGALPRWPHSRRWGYRPAGGLGLVLVILLILVLMGRL